MKIHKFLKDDQQGHGVLSYFPHVIPTFSTNTSSRSIEHHSYSNSFMRQCHQKSIQYLVILLLVFIPGFVKGLQCYECLSLACDSKQICESIKDTINSTFVRNSHYIHFDPRISCPGPHVSTNSTEWTEVVYNCSRSDSVCLEAPLEVITSFDGFRDGKKLEGGKTMSSWGFVRGCASRRGLRELPKSISVRKINMANETLPLKYKSTDEYKIEQIHYHEVYVDHGTVNATKCYMDECNNRRKHRVRSGASSLSYFSNLLILILSFFSTCFFTTMTIST